jgi:nucleoid DNA-binding protein
MDRTIEKIIDEIAEEQNIEREKVKYAIRHMCNWTREQLIAMNYKSILWSYFGKFSIIESRLDEQTKKLLEDEKENTNKSKDSQC